MSPQESDTRTPDLKRPSRPPVNPGQRQPFTTDDQATFPSLCLYCAYNRVGLRTLVPPWPVKEQPCKKEVSFALHVVKDPRCLGVPLERILFRTNEKASQNRHRNCSIPSKT